MSQTDTEKKAEDAGARAIQSRFRAFKAKNTANKKVLFESWAQLDIKEESELRTSQKAFEQLKTEFSKKAQGVQDEKATESFEQMLTAQLATVENEREAEVKNVSEDQGFDSDDEMFADADLPILQDGDTMTLTWVKEMIDEFKQGKKLQKQNLLQILARVQPILRALPNVVDLEIYNRITIVGDLHGQFDDLLTIFKLNGMPSEGNSYIFNGDFVDRGQHSSECCLTLFALLILYPHTMHLNRGNHEARDINSRDGFERECIEKYDAATFNLFSETFACLPLCVILDEEIMVVHGGLFYDDVKMQEIRDFDRFHVTPPPETLMEDMLWSDPCNQPGRYENSRGCACEFGPDVVDTFFANNQPIKMIIRSHECEDTGYAEWFGGKLYTVFSCSNYTGVVANEGAICLLEKDHRPRFVTYYAQTGLKQTRFNQRHGLLQEDIVTKLLVRIAANRLGLIDHFVHIDEKKEGNITREQWASGLQSVLELKIPFLRFQTYLGLPELGVHGRRNGPIDYMVFCNQYQLNNAVLGISTENQTEYAQSSQEFFTEMMSLLFQQRYELESLFRFFDTDGNGSISREEFRNGISSLATVLGKSFTDEQVADMVEMVDTDHSGEIDYSEFFAKFHTADEALLSQQRVAQQAVKRKTHLADDLPDFSGVKVVSVDEHEMAQGQGAGRSMNMIPTLTRAQSIQNSS